MSNYPLLESYIMHKQAAAQQQQFPLLNAYIMQKQASFGRNSETAGTMLGLSAGHNMLDAANMDNYGLKGTTVGDVAVVHSGIKDYLLGKGPTPTPHAVSLADPKKLQDMDALLKNRENTLGGAGIGAGAGALIGGGIGALTGDVKDNDPEATKKRAIRALLGSGAGAAVGGGIGALAGHLKNTEGDYKWATPDFITEALNKAKK